MTATTQSPPEGFRSVFRRVLTVGVGAIFVIGAISAGVAYATRPSAPLAPGTARLVPGDAAVTVHRVSSTAAADAPLRSGDVLTVVRGIAVVQTVAGTMFVRPGTTITFDGTSPRVERGDVLVTATNAWTLATQAANVTVVGTTRIRQGLSLDVGVYDGTADVGTRGESIAVPALRRAVIAGSLGATLGSTMPLALDPTDTWDRKLMGVAIELDAALWSRSRGLTLQAAGVSDDVRMKLMTTVEQWTDLTVLGPHVTLGEAVVAAELAKAGHLGHDAMNAALTLRAEGASWGLVAVSQGIKAVPPEIAGVDSAVVAAGAAIGPSSTATDVIPLPPLQTTSPPQIANPATDDLTIAPPPTVTQQGPVVVDPLRPLVKDPGTILSGLLG